jgi:hypothetical protein
VGLLAIIFVTSCAEGFKDDETFTGGVTNAQLEAVPADDLVITKNATATQAIVTWPVVYGAGGYEVTVYNVDDADNPTVVGAWDKKFVDGSTCSFAIADDSKYKVVHQVLGNAKLNNKAAAAATQVPFTTLLPAVIIPGGADLTAWFTQYRLDTVDVAHEKAFELEEGARYTLSGDVDLLRVNLTLRGNKVNRPTVVMTGGFRSRGGGSIFKYIRFECEGLTSSMFYGFNDIPQGAPMKSDACLVTNPVTFKACTFEKLPKPLFHDNGKAYAVESFTVTDCLVELTDNGFFYRNTASKGAVKDFLIENSTVYKNNAGTDYFMQLSGQRFTGLWTTASQSYVNCTFYRFDRMHNSNGYSVAGMSVNVKKCIFLDFLRDGAARYILPGGNVNNKILTFAGNTYWRNGQPDPGNGNYDKSQTELAQDPLCAAPAEGDFTVGNPATIEQGIGDPRWLPAAEPQTSF